VQIDPVSTHPTALITAIAARDKSRAQAQIDAYKSLLPGDVKAHGSYDAVVSDPDIDAVYIPLPNGLHHRWAVAALRNAKHVLIEKPMASNAREAREIRDAASAAGKVALEAFHWRFHPAAHTVKSMVLSGEYGPVRSVNAAMVFPAGFFFWARTTSASSTRSEVAARWI
jgi:predicted dehydrogenase